MAGSDTRAQVKAELACRIAILAGSATRMTTGRLACEVDGIRRDARASDLVALAALASGLERALGRTLGTTIALPYLEAMSGAVDCDDAAPGVTQRWLASVGVRTYGY